MSVLLYKLYLIGVDYMIDNTSFKLTASHFHVSVSELISITFS